MTALELEVDLSPFIDALNTGNSEQIIAVAREHLQHNESASILIGRLGMIAAHGAPEGHVITTLGSATMLCRLLFTIPAPVNLDVADGGSAAEERALPLFVQALLVAAPAIKAGHNAKVEYPRPLFPSELLDTGKSVNDVMREAVEKNDTELAERALLGLYGTGADYRTMQVRAYESIATTFQNAGHPLIFAVRGFQVLDAVEWGNRAPNIIHWLAPHLPLRPDAQEPEWIEAVRAYTADPAHSVASIRTRLSVPRDLSALSLRQVILSDADTTQVCQSVYDALIKGEASPRAVGSVIALAAADVMRMVGNGDRDLFVRVAHGLLFSAAARLVFRQVQDVEVLPLLFTSASYVNALQKEVKAQQGSEDKAGLQEASPASQTLGGGLIAAAQLETLAGQLAAQDVNAALTTSRRYLKLGHDPRALFGTIGLAAARTDARADQGHTLQIVQAAGEEFMAWPASLADTNTEGFLQIALRAAAFGARDAIVSQL